MSRPLRMLVYCWAVLVSFGPICKDVDMSKEQHKAFIVSDEPINLVNVVDGGGGRWFRVLVSLVESGAWARMSDGACRVYVVLAKHCGREWIAWPSLATVRRLSGISKAQVCRAINELQDEGLLRRRRGGGRNSTVYQLLELGETPSLPFPVRDSLAVSRARQQRSHGRDSSGLMGETRTRPVEQDSTNSSAAAAKLAEMGVENSCDLVAEFGAAKCLAAVVAVKGKRAVKNPAGLVVSMLRRDVVPAVKREVTAEDLSAFQRAQREASDRAAENYYASRWAQRSSGENQGL